MEVGVQAFFQEPWDLFSVPLLHVLHKLLQVCLMEGDKGRGEGEVEEETAVIGWCKTHVDGAV